MSDSTPPGNTLERHQLHLPRLRTLFLVALIGLTLMWLVPIISSWLSDLDLSTVEHPYAVIFGFVVFDAVIPVFPSESLLTTASNLAAQDDSVIELGRLIVAGSLGAIIGDSLLYWLSRTVLRRSISGVVEKAQQNEKVMRSFELMNRTAPTLIVLGRFVPGVRFMVNATMGLTKHRYPSFLLWSAIGGTLWASYTCVFSYLVATVIEDKPIASIAVSVVVTSGLLALMYKPLKKSWEQIEDEPVAAAAS